MMTERIPDEKASEVFELAAKLYAEHHQSYSVDDLVQAGSEVQIPPEYIQAALQQLRTQEMQRQQQQQQDQHRRSTLRWLAIGLGAMLITWTVWTYNALAGASQQVDLAWAQVENQLQRRADLIPNLVRVVQAGAQQEQDLATLLTQSRQNFLAADTPDERVAAATQLTGAVNQFQTYVGQNPQLRSTPLFIGLQDELAGTENRLAVERRRYNEAVAVYNQQVRSFPTALVAPLLGFQPQPLFTANQTSVPTVPADLSPTQP